MMLTNELERHGHILPQVVNNVDIKPNLLFIIIYYAGVHVKIISSTFNSLLYIVTLLHFSSIDL